MSELIPFLENNAFVHVKSLGFNRSQTGTYPGPGMNPIGIVEAGELSHNSNRAVFSGNCISISRELINFSVGVNQSGGYGHIGARCVNFGLFITLPIDVIAQLGLASFKFFTTLYETRKPIDKRITLSFNAALFHLIQAINHAVCFFFTPLALISPLGYRNFITHHFNFFANLEPFQSEGAKDLKAEAKERKIKFYSNCKVHLLSNHPKMLEDEAQIIAKIAYKNLVKSSPPTPIEKNRVEIIYRLQALHIELSATFSDGTVIILTKKLLGRGAYKKAYLGHKFNVDSTSLKINFVAVAVIRTSQKHALAALNENNLAACFNSRHVIKKSEYTFEGGGTWNMVHELLPFFFDELIPSLNDKRYFYTEGVGYVPYDPLLGYPKSSRTFKELIHGLEGIARGLYCIHEAGFLYRDLKPANMSIQDDGEGKIIDLGFTTESTGRLHTRSCSPAFASPEMVEGLNWKNRMQTVKSDLWSLGIALFVIFHPRHKFPVNQSFLPFFFKDLNEIKSNPENFKKNLFNDWIAENKADLSLQTLIAQLLSAEPSQRGTALEAAEALKEIQKQC